MYIMVIYLVELPKKSMEAKYDLIVCKPPYEKTTSIKSLPKSIS